MRREKAMKNEHEGGRKHSPAPEIPEALLYLLDILPIPLAPPSLHPRHPNLRGRSPSVLVNRHRRLASPGRCAWSLWCVDRLSFRLRKGENELGRDVLSERTCQLGHLPPPKLGRRRKHRCKWCHCLLFREEAEGGLESSGLGGSGWERGRG